MQEAVFDIKASFPASDLQRCLVAQRSLVSPICVRLGEDYFPEKDWTDFSIIVLSWWLEQVQALRQGLAKDATLRFMDGPYEIVLTTITNEVWAAMPFSHAKGITEQGRFAVSATEVVLSLYNAGREALAACRGGGFWDRDCDALERIILAADPPRPSAPS